MGITNHLVCVAALACASLSSASVTTQYTARTDLSGLISECRDLGWFRNRAELGGDLSGDWPTATSITQGWRVFGSHLTPPILVTFQAETSSIRVFNNIDHPESGYDYYQYSIYGSRDGVNYELLFDASTTAQTAGTWRLTGFTGTAPARVNTVVHAGINPAGSTGYVTDFNFSKSYFHFKFGASALAIGSGNADQELSGVGSLVPAPSCGLMVLLSAALRQRRRS